jgi:hypothetical protein
MNKNDLKKLIKPLVKECMHEVLLEEGLLSNIVSEVAKGMKDNLIVETKQKPDKRLFNEDLQIKRKSNESRVKLQDHRKKLMESIGGDAYNGVNIFEGTDPTIHTEPKQGQTDLGDPRDEGVDISSILGKSSQIWKAIK